MRRLVYLTAAQRDLMDILVYVTRESGSLDIGRGFVDLLRKPCQRLASLPGTLGRARPELRADIRSFPFRGYVIFFRYRRHTLEVVNILEGHRDIIAYFREGMSKLVSRRMKWPGSRAPRHDRQRNHDQFA